MRITNDSYYYTQLYNVLGSTANSTVTSTSSDSDETDLYSILSGEATAQTDSLSEIFSKMGDASQKVRFGDEDTFEAHQEAMSDLADTDLSTLSYEEKQSLLVDLESSRGLYDDETISGVVSGMSEEDVTSVLEDIQTVAQNQPNGMEKPPMGPPPGPPPSGVGESEDTDAEQTSLEAFLEALEAQQEEESDSANTSDTMLQAFQNALSAYAKTTSDTYYDTIGSIIDL
jgi:hypothetical protein